MEQSKNIKEVLTTTASMVQMCSSIQHSLSEIQKYIIARGWEPSCDNIDSLRGYEDELAWVRSSLNMLENDAELFSRKQCRS